MNGYFYDLANGFSERYLLAPLRKELLSSLRGEIVDVGAGTGANFPYYSPGTRVIALEPDPSMARRACSKRDRSAAYIEIQLEDDSALDAIGTASIDAVILTLMLCTVESPLATLQRAKRVLRPMGALVVLEHVRSDGNVGRFQDFIAPAWHRIAGGCNLNRNTKAAIAAANFDTTGLVTKTLPPFLPIQKIICGRVRNR